MRSDLINRIDQIGVYGKRVGGSGIADWTDAFALGADRGYNTYRINYPYYGWLPEAGFRYALEGLVGRHGIRQLFTAHTIDWVAE